MYDDEPSGNSVVSQISLGRVVLVIVAIFMAVALLVGAAAGCKSYNRYQKRADAHNEVRITAIQIQNQEQRVKIAQQQADIRATEADGIRRAQDKINATLTPLYVAHEMTQALKEIATSGQNNTVIYLPTDPATGLPVVPTNPAGTNNNSGGK